MNSRKMWIAGIVGLLIFVFPIGTMALDSDHKILDEVKAGKMCLSITVDETVLNTLPQNLTEQEVISWLERGWLTPEKMISSDPENAPGGGNCHLIYVWCGFPNYCIWCEAGTGDRRCNCMDANL